MDVAELAPDTTLAAARLLVRIFTVYAALGVVVGIAFVARGAERLDHEARGGSLGFRLLIFPASAALWPFLLLRWRRANGEAPVERSAHRDRAAAPSEAAPGEAVPSKDVPSKDVPSKDVPSKDVQ